MKTGDIVKCHDPRDLEHMLNELRKNNIGAEVCDKKLYVIKITNVPEKGDVHDVHH